MGVYIITVFDLNHSSIRQASLLKTRSHVRLHNLSGIEMTKSHMIINIMNKTAL